MPPPVSPKYLVMSRTDSAADGRRGGGSGRRRSQGGARSRAASKPRPVPASRRAGAEPVGISRSSRRGGRRCGSWDRGSCSPRRGKPRESRSDCSPGGRANRRAGGQTIRLTIRRAPRSWRPESLPASPPARWSVQTPTFVLRSARYFSTAMAAVVASPTAVVTCRVTWTRTSPAANSPGIEVIIRSSVII